MTGSPASAVRALPIVLATIFIDMLGIGILIPVIPQLLANPASHSYLLPAGWTLEQGYVLLGLLTAAYPFMMFLAAPVLGQLSDQRGRRRVLAVSLTGTAVSYVLFAVAILQHNIPLLFLSRALDGITGGNISVAQATIADITTPENRSKTFGLMGAVFGLGFIIGPFLGGKLADPSVVGWFNAATPFWFAAVLSGCNVLSVLFFLPETRTPRTRVALSWTKSVRDIARAWSFPQMRTLFVVSFLFHGGFTFFTTFFGVYLIERFGYTEGDIGEFFAYIGLWVVFTQAVVTRRLAARVSEVPVLRWGFIVTGMAVLLYMLPNQSWWLFVITPVFAIANGLTQANFMGLLSRSAGADVQGEILGINSSIAALSQSIPPVLSGLIAARTAPTAPSYVAAGSMVLAGIIFLVAHRPSGGLKKA